MVHYRRNRVPGGSYFFTVTLHDRRSDLLVQHIDILRKSFAAVMAARPFIIDAIVVMPEHLHAIWTLPPEDADYPGRWRAIKARFTQRLRQYTHEPLRSPWQSRFWEHTLRNDADFQRHVDYIHYNPVKHGHVSIAADWPYSSFHRYVKTGLYAPDWGTNDIAGDFGEPQ
ncbi:MAG: transposase [Gammaproteobacteria bacterium HGW-Gammaproteobacteria-1]|jgi:putative transposase|nr:MAG: transposase [Gammaproteobacteria bacterium HGW-Gammaproteobacteria-1]